jgi:wyosine [tRNA(Phe)-imidazoG37] synthetase (radical SAM superfamily)
VETGINAAHASAALSRLITGHERAFAGNRFVYPVLSRRSGGMSIGVNLNPDKVCNFDCIYCQVNRVSAAETRFVAIDALAAELEAVALSVTTRDLFRADPFRAVPTELRRLNDIAFSGDGEPTTYGNFDDVISRCAAVKKKLRLDDVKMVLITNASMFHRPRVQRGLSILDQNQGEIWAKLDAGTEAYYQIVERTKIPFRRILKNVLSAARVRPIVIQAMFMRINGHPPSDDEQAAFCDRLAEIVRDGGRIRLVQVYTVARRPAEDCVTPLSDAEVDQLTDLVKRRTGLAARAFYGAAYDS